MLLHKILFVLLACHVSSGEAFLGSIGTAILDGIKNMFIGLFKAIWNGILSAFKYVILKIKESLIALVTDISEALSLTTEIATEKANKTLQNVFGTKLFDTSRMIMNLMYKGELPIHEYRRQFDVDLEFEFMDRAIMNLKVAAAIDLGFTLIFTLILIFLICYSRSIRQDWKSVMAFQSANNKKKTKKPNDRAKKHKRRN